MTAGAMRWRTARGCAARPSERIVKALGEPLVVVRRSALNDVLAGALATAPCIDGVTAKRSRTDRRTAFVSRCRIRRRATGGRGDRRGRHTTRWWPATSTARCTTGTPATPRGAGSPITPSIPTWPARPWAPGLKCGHVPIGPRSHVLVRHRARAGGTGRTGRRAGVPANQVRIMGRAHTGAAGGDRSPMSCCATTSTTATRREAGRAGPVVLVGDAAHPMRPHLGQGGCQGLEDAAILASFVEQSDDLATAFARFAAVPQAQGAGLGARVGTDRPARQPAAGLPERRGQPGHGLGARGGADAASGGGGVAVGVRRARDGLSLGRSGLRKVEHSWRRSMMPSTAPPRIDLAPDRCAARSARSTAAARRRSRRTSATRRCPGSAARSRPPGSAPPGRPSPGIPRRRWRPRSSA